MIKLLPVLLILSALITSCAQTERKIKPIPSEISGAVGDIYQSVTRAWVQPTLNLTDNSDLSVKLAIKTNRTGEVVEISVVESSGIEVFDFSALEAVKKASPFSSIASASENEYEQYFKKVNFIFKPYLKANSNE